ncbi:MAG: TadG family pilus assembly protein [Candidatus Dormibacteraeota bacterium]|nr:TadG family pilus assembly protein [Candidatus Dormibacteraeota bacterium]
MSQAAPVRRRWSQSRSGQVMVIFALSAVVLFALMGLAIDAGISYLHSDLQQRAAAAAALSGVAYLPGDTAQATQEALLTAQRDGYPNTSPDKVVVTEPTTNELEVAITAPAPVYFMGLLGFGTHNVTAYATAEYLPPIQMGQPGNQLGTIESQVGSGGNNYYFLRTEGWGNPRSEGDAFTPTPTETASSCPPAGSCTANPPDVHQISCIDGTDTCYPNADGLLVNDTGGYNYLIWVPAGTTADIQVYNPSFDPGTDNNNTVNTYHDDDGSFPTLGSYNQSVRATDYAAMGFTLYAVPVLYSRQSDVPLLQDVFCPFNAYNLDRNQLGYSYYEATSSGNGCDNPRTASATQITLPAATAPPVFHSWISLNQYAVSAPAAEANLFYRSFYDPTALSTYGTDIGGVYYLAGGSGGRYFRLRVDTLAWDGAVINQQDTTNSPSVNSSSGSPDGYPYAHDAYALQVVTPMGGSGNCAAGGASACTVSALADMALYTPIKSGSTSLSFDVPLFYLPTAYAGKVISVRVFDPGDVGGDAYLGIQQPEYTSSSSGNPVAVQFASLLVGSNGPEADNLGTSLGAGGNTPIAVNGGSFSYGSDSAVIQTSKGGGAIYNGQWVQFNIQVPSDYQAAGTGTNPGYWSLWYGVGPNTTAGDTITVEVQYLGSPVHLLPGS